MISSGVNYRAAGALSFTGINSRDAVNQRLASDNMDPLESSQIIKFRNLMNAPNRVSTYNVDSTLRLETLGYEANQRQQDKKLERHKKILESFG